MNMYTMKGASKEVESLTIDIKVFALKLFMLSFKWNNIIQLLEKNFDKK